MKYYLLAAIAALILIFAVVTAFVYNNWKEGRYDEIISREADRYEEIPPALIKAMVFGLPRKEGAVGVMAVPLEGLEAYKQLMMTRSDYGFVCVNQHKPPHEMQIFEEAEPCPVCGVRYVEEFRYPEKNIEIGTFYLAYLKRELEKALVKGTDASLELALFAYQEGWEELEKQTDKFAKPFLNDNMRHKLSRVLSLGQKYKKQELRKQP